MPSFTRSWDDFTGKYYVGEIDANQPNNMFTGKNVNTTTWDGSVVAMNGQRQLGLQGVDEEADEFVVGDSVILGTYDRSADPNGGAELVYVTQPIRIGDYIFFAFMQYYNGYEYPITGEDRTPIAAGSRAFYMQLVRVDFSDPLSTGGVVSFSQQITSTWPINTPPYISNIVTANQSNVQYVYFGHNQSGTIYRYRVDDPNWDTNATATATTISTPSSSIYGLALWNARLVSWSRNSDTFYFSDALSFSSWPTLNFLAPGFSNDGIISIVPRFDDLLVIKPTGIFSITGVLGTNSYVRKIGEDIYPIDRAFAPAHCNTIVSHNNVTFFVPENTAYYSTNINYVSGNEVGVSAFNVFGSTDGANGFSTPSAAVNANGSTVFMAPLYIVGAAGHQTLIRERSGKWIRYEGAALGHGLPYDPEISEQHFFYRYVPVATVQNSISLNKPIYVEAFSSNDLVFAQIATMNKGSYNFGGAEFSFDYTEYGIDTGYNFGYAIETAVSFAIFPVDQTNSGIVNADAEDYTAAEGLLRLKTLETDRLSKVTRIYVEADLELDESQISSFTGEATMNVTVVNGAVDDKDFYPELSYTATTRNYDFDTNDVPPASTVDYFATTNQYKRVKSTRILRFDANDTGYGYKHNIEITFGGFRIKRVWVEGETR